MGQPKKGIRIDVHANDKDGNQDENRIADEVIQPDGMTREEYI
jgi:hypothetical protein